MLALALVVLCAEPIDAQLAARFAGDAAALEIATKLYAKAGDVITVIPEEEDFEGGYRGIIRIVPQLPIGPERKHLEWVAAALSAYDDFFGGLEKTAGVAPKYRWRDLEVRFFKSIKGRKTPAAFASGFVVSYNTNGTLNGSEKQVRDLLFHELFHSNDADHGDWSARALRFQHMALRVKCGTDKKCLEPYAPDPLIVRGGTYYSFQTGNDEHEYGADLALRYWREQNEVLAGRTVKVPFKCRTDENARVWAALIAEFFAGVDRVPACVAK